MGRIVIRKSTRNIWLFSYPQFEAMDDCQDKMVWLSERDINLIWNSIQNISLIQSRVYNDASGDTYEIVENDEFEIFQQWVATMRNNLGAWTVCNDIMLEIRDAILQVANKACCPSGGNSGSRGSGSSEAPPNTYNEEQDPGTPPPGFDSYEQYDARKCEAAEDILNNLKADLIGLSGITYSGATPTGLVGALILFLLTPIPFDDLIGLAAYLIYSAYSYTFLAEMSAKIGENQNELRCILYNAPTVEAAETNLFARLEEIALDYFTTEDDANWVMGAVEYMLQYDAFNVLFENLPTVSEGADCTSCGGDCDACDDAEMFIWDDIGDQGIILSSTPGFEEVVYEVESGSYQGGTIDFFLSTDSNPANQCNQLVTITITGGTFTPASPSGWRTWNALGELTYEGDVPPPSGFPICVSNVSLRSSTAFEIEVTAEW